MLTPFTGLLVSIEPDPVSGGLPGALFSAGGGGGPSPALELRVRVLGQGGQWRKPTIQHVITPHRTAAHP